MLCIFMIIRNLKRKESSFEKRKEMEKKSSKSKASKHVL